MNWCCDCGTNFLPLAENLEGVKFEACVCHGYQFEDDFAACSIITFSQSK